MNGFALAERVHGHLALLGLALILHPVIRARGNVLRGRARLTADLGALLLLGAALGGAALYPDYRRGIKPTLLAEAPLLAQAFESKEHLGAFSAVLAVAGALVLRAPGGVPTGRALLTLAFLTGALAAVAGVLVASAN